MADSFDIAKKEINLVEFIEKKYPDSLFKRGSVYFMSCPFSGGEDNTPSFAVYEDHFYCYHCGKNGSIIDYVIEDNDFKSPFEALQYLDKEFPSLSLLDEATLQRVERKSKYISWATRQAEAYSKTLKGSKTYLNAIMSKRGFSEDSIDKFMLGLRKDGDYYRISIPQITEGGKVLAFVTRKIHPDDPLKKYMAYNIYLDENTGKILTNGDIKDTSIVIWRKSEFLYNYNSSLSSNTREIVLVEGHLDVIAADELGIFNVVAYGTKMLSDSQVRLLEPFDIITLIPDTDAYEEVYMNIEKIRNIFPYKSISIVDITKDYGNKAKDVGDILKIARNEGNHSYAVEAVQRRELAEKWLYDRVDKDDEINKWKTYMDILKVSKEPLSRSWLISKISAELEIDPSVLSIMINKMDEETLTK